jgi:DNA-binding beta-propeller fold protein YncE
MKSRQLWKPIAGALTAACLLFSGCKSSSGTTKVAVTLNTPSVGLFVNQTFLFTAFVTGATDTSVTFALTSTTTTTTGTTTTTSAPAPCSPGCGALSGADKTSVTYTAPATVPNPVQTITLTATATADSTAKGTAAIALDSGIRVSVIPATATIGTGESFQFLVTLTNDSTPNDVTWTVKETGAGAVDANGKYTGPATVPSPATATVVATSKLDTTRTGSATVTIVDSSQNQVAFTDIQPRTAPLGGIFQDVYLAATNLRTTSTVRFNGVPIPPQSPQLKIISAKLARLRLKDAQLNAAGSFRIQIDGATETGGPFNVQVIPMRPALIATQPDSTLENATLSPPLKVNGGYYGPASGPTVTARFNGDNPHVITVSNSRQLSFTLNPGDLGTAGLFSVSVVNNAAAPPIAAANFAVQPDPISNGPGVPTLLPLKSSPTDTPAPSAIAIDTTIGIAIVANTGNNTVQRLSITGTPPSVSVAPLGGQIALAGSPTGVAVDEERHIAAVAVSKSDGSVRNVTVVDLQTGAINGTIDLKGVTAALPFAVGLDSTTGLGIVAFSSTNIGAIYNVEATAAPQCTITGAAAPYCVTGVVSLNTGGNPQIAFEPRLRWAFVTPGGAGLMSVVDLGAPQNRVAIAATAGAKRTVNVVTIITAANHNLNPTNPGTVLITDVTDAKFNGAFAVTSVVDAKTFTYSQTEADATSGGGFANFSNPLLTFALSQSVRGIAINEQTGRAILADASSNFPSFLSTLDQTNLSASLGHPTTGAAFQPFTNVAVLVKPGSVGATGVDRITLLDPTRTAQIGTLPQGILAELDTGGTGSGAVAIDPATNLALVANAGSHDISVISLSGPIHAPQISRVLIPSSRRLFPQGTSFSSTTPAADLPVQIFGAGFTGSPQVRLDGVILPGATVKPGGREIDVGIPASFLTAPRRYALDVVIGSNFSNVTDFTVVEAVDVTGTGCAAPQPTAVAIDDQRDLAIAANIGCNNVSVIDLTNGQITQTIAVGTAPAGVAVIPRLGLAVVSNSNVNLTTGASTGAGTVSVVDLTQNKVTASPTVGTTPGGVAINPDTGVAFVLNSGSNTVSALDLTATTILATNAAVDQRPISIAIDPDRGVALVGAVQLNANSTQGVLDVLDVSSSAPIVRNRISSFTSLPTGIAFDPVNTFFYAVSSLTNTFQVVNPDTGQAASVRVGVNPTSLAYNPETGTLVTVNSASNTLSFVDMQSFRTTATIGMGTVPPPNGTGNPQFAVAIHPRTNLAVITDAANNRVLLFPLPR